VGSDAHPIDRLTTEMSGRHARGRASQAPSIQAVNGGSRALLFTVDFLIPASTSRSRRGRSVVAGQKIEHCKNKRSCYTAHRRLPATTTVLCSDRPLSDDPPLS
jgi:hypothetical protein